MNLAPVSQWGIQAQGVFSFDLLVCDWFVTRAAILEIHNDKIGICRSIYGVNPKALLLVLSTLIVVNSAVRAETLVTTNGEIFRLNISTGQVAMVSHYFTSDVANDYPFIIAKGETNIFPLYVNFTTRQPQAVFAFAGPMEIVRTNVGSRTISYQLLSGNSILSEIITATATNVINVPSGKTIKFFQPFPVPGSEISINITV